MGLPMYVSPSISKRQLPTKQPTSPPYTPQSEENFEEPFQNSRTGSFDITVTEFEPGPPQRSQRSRRSSSLPYNLVQHMHRLQQLQQLHRTRDQQQMTSNLALRRGLNSAHHLSLNRAQMQNIQQMQQMQAAAIQARRQDRNLSSESSFEPVRNIRDERLDDSHDEIIDFSFDDFVSSLDSNNNNNNGDVVQRNNNVNINNNNQTNNDNDNSNNHSYHRSSNMALDSVIRRVNLLRQISQQQEVRSMRPSSSRHHRSSIGHSSSGRSSRITSQNINVGQRRDDLIQRGIDIPIPQSSSVRHSVPDSTLSYEYNTPLHPMPRLSAWHTRRSVNWPTVDPQRTERRSSFADDFYSTSEISHQYELDDHHLSRILSPIPRRYEARFSSALSSLPIGSDHELLESGDNNRSNVDTEQRGSASGEVC